MIKWTLKEVLIKEIKENPKNPRQISKDKCRRLGQLIDKFGLIDKPILNQDYMLIGGHQRIRLLKKAKIKTVECWMPDRLLEQSEADELCIGHNLHQGSFDYDLLGDLWQPIDLLTYGFTEEQLIGVYSDDAEKEELKEKKKNKKECPACGHMF